MDKAHLLNFTSLQRFQIEVGGDLHDINSLFDLLYVVSRVGDKITVKCPTGKFGIIIVHFYLFLLFRTKSQN